MKPAPFTYCRPDSLADVLALLGEYGDEAAVLAGGLSLGPLLNMRMARPEVIVDINRLDDLARIERDGDYLRTGALVRQADALASAECQEMVPLLVAALGYVGHYQTRSRGTLVGSVAHADPSAEVPLCLTVLGGEVELTSERQVRRVRAGDFFLGALTTGRAEDEFITALLWPIRRSAIAFEEVSERRGDFAIVAAAAWAECSADGIHYGLGLGGIEDRPIGTSGSLEDTSSLAERVSRELIEGLEAMDDNRASAAYRRHLASHLGQKVLQQVLQEVAS
ncbi:MAG: FAD binding domain-containing protein [Alphaproteobacteria bacterium]